MPYPIVDIMKNIKAFLIVCLCLFDLSCFGQRSIYNFDMDWYLSASKDTTIKYVGNRSLLSKGGAVNLPRAFNENAAFRVRCNNLPDGSYIYHKTFRLPPSNEGKKVFIEFEGVRQAAAVYVNGHKVGINENGIMAFGFDITPYIFYDRENTISVEVNSSWAYREVSTNSTFEWNDRNFYANYGGINKHVKLYITDKLYQTLPLYDNLGTTGVYVYATNIDIENKKAVIHAESQVKNETGKDQSVKYEVEVFDVTNHSIAKFTTNEIRVKSYSTAVLSDFAPVSGLHFWSWGYGYLYTIKTRLIVNGVCQDEVSTHTGFRKTRFADGKIWLNDRVLMMKGYAQRTTNEWPGVGLSVPTWLSDYSNNLMVKGNADLVRWMHVTPWKQDVESCDRVGLIESMPAGDSEKDADGRQWEQRMEVMRGAIIYNRNNPSILFYECGNKGISKEHMIAMKSIRDRYDPYGGRAIGCREMLDVDEAEYGGEMLYINKSAKKPMWAMEYCRDEALRKYWDDYSYPYHKDGVGPLYKGGDASDYNRNCDSFALEHVRRWYDYWQERPGMGNRVSAGGVKIVFSDTNTHARGESVYRTSGVVDAMRIPKDSYYVNQVMWNGWVDIEKQQTYIIGHWNYNPGTVKNVYVVSTAPRVELFLNGKSLGYGECSSSFLYTFKNVAYQYGELKAVGMDEQGKILSEYTLQTAGTPAALRLTVQTSPQGFHADGSDMALVQVEVVDKNGKRCPLDNRTVKFSIEGPAEWRGGIANGKDNCILSKILPVECGVNRVLIRSTRDAGTVKLAAVADSLPMVTIRWEAKSVENKDGLSTYFGADAQTSVLDRGETPPTPSYTDKKFSVAVKNINVGANADAAKNTMDDNENTEWENDGNLSSAWITYELLNPTVVNEVVLKLTGWRSKSYPLEVYADNQLVWKGNTDVSLGYVHLLLKPVKSSAIAIRMTGRAENNSKFGDVKEVSVKNAGQLDHVSSNEKGCYLRIVEADLLTNKDSSR